MTEADWKSRLTNCLLGCVTPDFAKSSCGEFIKWVFGMISTIVSRITENRKLRLMPAKHSVVEHEPLFWGRSLLVNIRLGMKRRSFLRATQLAELKIQCVYDNYTLRTSEKSTT